ALFGTGRPEHNGLTFARQLRVHPLTARLPVLLVTASLSFLREHGESLQAEQIPALLKPFRLKELYGAIDLLLAHTS
ncbi:MAG TPA: hypothetical protein VFN35_26370, partial [Ktedonobacteraceae bacterium]|nr:hypothetical protein [Ktedonobacteraceae bacterium]